MSTPGVWATAQLAAGAGRSAEVDVNGYELPCEIPLDDREPPTGPTSFGLLAAALSTCTAMSARTFLQTWHVAPEQVDVHVAFQTGPPTVLMRRVTLAATVPVELREQLAAIIDSTPVTVLLRDSLPIVTEIVSPP